jgi:hypothetical protein
MHFLVEKIIFFIIFTIASVYAEQIANHAEVILFREKQAEAIAQKKGELRSQLDVVGALAVLEPGLDGPDSIENSRLALGMMAGNGYKDGVTTRLVASLSDKAVIERIVKKAAAHVRAPFRVEIDNIWQAMPSPATAQHVAILNRWVAGVVRKDPQFSYEPKRAERYKSLDVVINDICGSFVGKPANNMIQHALVLSRDLHGGLIAKNFILCFAGLSAAEKQEIVKAYEAAMRLAFLPDQRDAELQALALQCQNRTQAKEFIRERIAPVPLPVVVVPMPAFAFVPPKPLQRQVVLAADGGADAGAGGPGPAVVEGAAAIPNDEGVDIAKIEHLLAELRRFDVASGSGRYAEVSKTILIMKALYENKDRIIRFANNNWENVRLMRDIDSAPHPGYGMKIRKGHTQCEYFRAVVEDIVVKVQYDLRDRVDPALGYAPVFETVDYVFGVPIVDLPTDKDGRDLIFTTITTHLIDGAKMLTKAANWLEGNPAYYRTFFTGNWGDNSGCIPKRNEMLSDWINTNTKVLTGKYIYNKFLIYPFDRSVGMLMDLFRQNCYVSVIRGDIALVYVSDAVLEAKPAFKLLYTKANFIEWVQPVVRDAYLSSTWPRGFEYHGWNDLGKIGAIWDLVVGD